MGCCGDSSVSPEAKDPEVFFFKKRRCTDIFCLLFFLLFWGGIGYLSYLSITVGDPYEILYGADYLGNRCGVGSYKDKKYVYYPRADKDILEQAAIASSMPWRLKFYGLCMADCPQVSSPTACFSDASQCTVYDYGTPAQYGAAGGSAYYYATMPSVKVLHRCIPNDNSLLNQEDDLCAFPQCDNVNYFPCDETYNTTWKLTGNYPRSKKCEVTYRRGEIQQLKPVTEDILSRNIGEKMNTASRGVESLMESITEVSIFGGALPLLFGFAFLVLLRLFAKTVIYVSLIALGIGMLCLSLYCFVAAGVFEELWGKLNNNLTVANANTSATDAFADDPEAVALGLVDSATTAIVTMAPSDLDDAIKKQDGDPTVWYVAGAIIAILFFIYVISMCLARKRIKTAVALVKQSTVVIKERPMLMLFPFATLTVQLCFLAFFILLGAFLFTADLDSSHFTSSLDGITKSSSFLEYLDWFNGTSASDIKSADDSASNVQLLVYLYLVFGLLWTIEVITNISWTAMSGAVSHWFFFRESAEHKTRAPLLRSLGRVLCYHLGTIVFGAFIVGVIKLIRLVLMIIDKYTKDLQKSNPLFWLIIKCTQCCMYCLEKTIKFITNYAYIYVALQGSGFCKACFQTFSLIFANPAQLSINSLVRIALKWIQLITVPLGCAWMANIALVANQKPDPIYATTLIALMALVIASIFATVFGCVLDTLFVCCCRDKADYEGKYMPDMLKKVYGFHKKGKGKDGDVEVEELIEQ